MNDFMLMAPANQTFGELLSNGVKYIIPRFQRDYAWDQEQWEDLWVDIESLDKEGYHYMGYIVLQKKGQYDFEVIDGQQRLITMSFIVLAAMRKIKDLADKCIEADDNKERLHVFHERMIGSKNPITLKVDNKLSLNRNNRRHFREVCSRMNALNERNLSKTNQLLNNAFEWFKARISADSGSGYAEFIEKITTRMVFTKIVTRDNIDAYKVFETLNARGVQLSTPYLLKNHIFSTLTANDDVSDGQLDELDEDWASVITQLGENNFTDYVRYHHNIQKKTVSKRELFKSVKQLVRTPRAAGNYLISLSDYAPVYAALLNPYDEWWQSYGDFAREIKHYLEGMSLFRIRQPFPVLMAAPDKFRREEFVKAARYLYVLSIRYNIVCRLSPNEQEKAYNKIAMKIFNGDFKRASHIKNSEEFKRLYPNDKAFKNAFEFYKMPSRRSSRKIRFLLTEIENSFGRKLSYLDTTLEHVCPCNPEQGWYKDFGEGINDITDRLGNMVLLEKDQLKRADFNTKKQTYLQSSFRLAKKVGEYDTWDLPNLNHYQQWLADQAVKTWRVDL
ncbi:DUF262 domain-containing HNH endonuclease family protein [Desulfococcaceae bacterium HSG8]|nr:DUF262 domain-containing HNH endonuclease family protein [Desulfococcaceae bacterium HSG8]